MFDPATATESRDGDVELSEFGKLTRMPWEVDGPDWHTRQRVGRSGEPCRWDGQILAEVVQRIEATREFAETNWNARTIVEITGAQKSHGWFLHAITGETWLLKLKFRVARNTFRREKLLESIRLKPLNEMDELPVYGNEPRIKCKNLRGPWQEVELKVHSWAEVDQPGFWEFLEQAIAGFRQIHARATHDPEELMPWKKLGRQWHLSRKGFPPGKKVHWQPEVLEELCDMLGEKAPKVSSCGTTSRSCI